MSISFNPAWLEPAAAVPVDVETTAALLLEVKRMKCLIDETFWIDTETGFLRQGMMDNLVADLARDILSTYQKEKAPKDMEKFKKLVQEPRAKAIERYQQQTKLEPLTPEQEVAVWDKQAQRIAVLEQAARQALEALEPIHHGNITPMAENAWKAAITTLREALEAAPQPAAPTQDPAAWAITYDGRTPHTLWHEGDGPLLDLEIKRQGGSAQKMALYTAPQPAAVEQEPVAWMFQHEEAGLIMCVDVQQVESGFEKNNPRWQKVCPLYKAPQPTRQPLTDEQIDNMVVTASLAERDLFRRFARAVERDHGIGGEA